MPSETSHNRPPQPQASATTTTPRQPKTPTSTSAAAVAAGEPLPCPRCDSINTKFCYYNNYSLVQPRHFCKSCRRYWTHGGALRNVPIGGGTSKSSSSSSKRRRAFYSSSAAPASSASHSPHSSTSLATTSSALSTLTHEPETLTVSVPSKVEGLPVGCGDGDNLTSGSMLTMNQAINGLYMGLGGYGYGFYESGLGVVGTAGGKGGVLPYHAMGLGNYLNLVGGVSNTWQLLGEAGVGASGVVVDAGLVEGGGSSGCGDSFARPGLAISTPGDNSSK